MISKEPPSSNSEKRGVGPSGAAVELEKLRELEITKSDTLGISPASAPTREAVLPSATTAPYVMLPKSQLEKEIEDVLAEDLENLYWDLPEPERLIFKHKGEETASKIRFLLGEATIRVQEIFRLIVEWLKFLPGVSHFFIEQEAKIKTDKVLKFH